MPISIRPTEDRILVKPNEPKRQIGDIFVPDNFNDGNNAPMGEVIAVGPGRLLENGTRVKPFVKVGDTVIVSSYATKITIDGIGQRYLIQESEIVGIVDEA